MEHRRISSGKQPGCCEVCNLIPINENQLKKFECEDLQKKIDTFAKEAGFKWHVETGNLETMSAVCKEIPSPVTDIEMHDLDMQHINFLKYIDVLEIPVETACDDKENHDLIDFEEEGMEKKNVEVIEKLLHDLNLPEDDNRRVLCATVIDATTIPILVEPTCWGHICHNTLKEMCELYLKAHSHE